MNKNFSQLLVSIRRQIHQNPELGDKEYKTTTLLEKTLKAHGIKTLRPGKTGVVGIVEGTASKSSRCVALRGDIDALPITEQTGAPFSSKTKGIMHACGHDANATMALGAALLLAEKKSTFSGIVKCLFQPNEESSGGAKGLVRAGVLKRVQQRGHDRMKLAERTAHPRFHAGFRLWSHAGSLSTRLCRKPPPMPYDMSPDRESRGPGST